MRSIPLFRSVRTVALLAAGTVALSACGNGGGAPGSEPAAPGGGTTAAAGGDGTITLYSGRNEELVQPILDAFTQQTGIQVQVRYGQTAEMAAQMLEEGQNTPAEVFLAQDAGALGAVANEGLVEELPEELLERVPESYRDDDGEWVGVTGRARVLAYDPAQVSQEQLPATVEELTAPEWQGRVGVAPTNASFQSFVTAMRVSKGEEETERFLTGLAANQPQIREKNGQIVADIDAGTLPVGLVNHYYLGELAAEKGVAVDELNARLHFFGDGDIGGLVNVSGVALTQGQADDEGRRLVEYLLSDEAQQKFVEETYEYPLVEGVQGPEGVPALSELQQPDVDLNDLDSLSETVELVKRAGLS